MGFCNLCRVGLQPLSTVAVGVAKMELTSAPGRVCWSRPWTTLTRLGIDTTAADILFVDRINVTDDETVGWAICWVPPLIPIRPIEYTTPRHHDAPPRILNESGRLGTTKRIQGDDRTALTPLCRSTPGLDECLED
jgi:hypothetical protein